MLLKITFSRIFKAKSPIKKAKIKAIRLLIVKRPGDKILFISSKMAPTETGMNKAKEKLKALTGNRPKRIPEKIVKPERETPGRMATA